MPGGQPSVVATRASLPVSVTHRVALADSPSAQTQRDINGDESPTRDGKKNRDFLSRV
jgi:hypothetical protein